MSNILFNAIPPSESGIDYTGATWGGAWGDVNSDSYPDLWVGNHYGGSGSFGAHSILYLNQGNGTFRDATAEIFVKQPIYDLHGTAWADFDNDGDQDLVQLVGGGAGVGIGPEYSKQFYVNEGGILEDRAISLGVDYPLARGRNPLWFDFNKDGLLDLVVGVVPRTDGLVAPAKIFQQRTDGTFEDVSAIMGFNLTNASSFFLSDLSGDGNLDLIANEANWSSKKFTVYDTTQIPFRDITSETIFNAKKAYDVAVADFNGDLRPDLYLTIGAGDDSDLNQNGADKATVSLSVNKNEKGLQFDTSGEVTFDLQALDSDKSQIPLNQIYIGKNGTHPISWNFTLSPNDTNIGGILPHTQGVDRGIYIGFDADLQRWQLLLSSSEVNNLIGNIETTEPISELSAIGFQADPPPPDDQLLINTGQGFIDQSDLAGINSIPIRGRSVTAGDFDNDMDQDIYIVTNRSVLNTPDILLENQGDGIFVAISGAGGAEGTEIGQGDFVMAADYDLNGFLDLLVANGHQEKTSPLITNAPYQLFHNQGNSNHWLEIDLQGVASNRDGIGAQVFLTAGGVTQLREQSGGIHNAVQNYQRLHFGLADNTSAQELIINWPSGRVQVVENIPADQLVRITEPVNDGPTVIAPQVDQAVKYDTTDWSYDASISFSDTDTSNSLSYSATLANGNPLPIWMLFNTTTGFISGTPGLADLGTYALIVTVTDSHGLSASAPLTIAVTLFDAGKLLVNTDGNDTLVGTLSNDTVTYYYSTAPVTVSLAIAIQQDTGGAGLDILTNIDNLIGSDYSDRLVGDAKNNILDGGIGNDTLNGNIGADTLIGGLGDDYYLIDNVADTIIENINEGIDTINSNMTYALLANVENLTLRDASAINGTGNDLANNITGNSAANQLNGGAGNDKLNGNLGADILIGGLGDDFYNVDNEADTVIENINEGTDAINSSVTYTLSANVENLTLTGGSVINGTGNSLANTITGNAAINVLNGGAGTDSLIGGLGDDIYTVDNAGDVITEYLSEGIDKVNSSVTYTLPTNVENFTLTGALAINGIGNDLANSITGNAAFNQLNGGAGNDTLNGAAGADSLIGGLGDDFYNVDNEADTVIENINEGTDKVSSSVTYTLSANVENLTLTGGSATNGTGNDLANIIVGNAASNQLNGGAGNDTLNGVAGADSLIGGLGDDFYNVDNGADIIIENINEGTDKVSSSVTYTLSANVENLILRDTSAINGTGNDLANSLTGNTASNQLDGGAGNDILDGGTGANMLTGGIGKDIFKLTSAGHIDTITDFIVVDDTIQLENAVFTSLTTTGILAFDQFVSGVQALDKNDFIIYNNVTGSLLYDADGSGVGSAVKIAAIGVGLAMTNADIVVI